MTDENDPDGSRGLMLACGYRWCGGQPWMAPGHCTVLRRDGELYLVNHVRQMNFAGPEPSTLQIRRLLLTEDGWPVTAALPYAGETRQAVPGELIPGRYERIELRPQLPQGIQHAHGAELLPSGRLEMGSIVGRWSRTGESTLEVGFGPHREQIFVLPGWDRDEDRPCLTMCGLTERGTITWYKKRT